MISSDVIELLETEATAINHPDFIDEDPVQFPRRFSDKRDIEISALLVSSIAWGNRKMILRDSERMLSLMDNQPYVYMMDEGYEELPDGHNIHRTFFTQNLKHYLRGLRQVYVKHDTLDDFCRDTHANVSETPAWALATRLNQVFSEANDGHSDSRCLPLNTDATALKRLNMALRWLVRNDGIVDLGVWESLKPSQLYIPLDVHVASVSRDLGLLVRKSNDRKAVLELTDNLRPLRPHDPAVYDFALFGIGVTGRRKDLAL